MISERTKSILLFTSYFAKSSDKSIKPLTNTEWNRLVRWLQSKSISPEDFLSQDNASLLLGWQDKTITSERIDSLLERKSALAIALDKWTKAGIWIINRGDKQYPRRLKERLKDNAPPILFGIGNADLLNKQYIGIVGARKTTDNELFETKKIGKKITSENFGIVSGGAKGVDESAMLGALEANGNCIGFVSDSLIRKSTTSTFRKYIINKRLVLLSPFNPEASFNVGNAMTRNKLIYTQSEATIVVKSDTKGGTWEGAKENLKKQWVPLWVIYNKEVGNNELIKLGANKLLPENEYKIEELVKVKIIQVSEPNLFSSNNSLANNIAQEKKVIKKEGDIIEVKLNDATLFDYFIFKLYSIITDKPLTKKDIKDKLSITNSQLDEWLKMACAKEFIIKNNRPVTFILNKEKKIRITS
ncbi:DNA-processing protein DprA [Halosquirtibacter xylanolyticus]|uniref:DNA-processing protein DprA n=1 Tax=Halosquirtibacter xylanolyticus TaxID=3374599 RepID=UPI00374A33E1|nr:DNA-processing protein DprA [Prolixibacteraceae bacterium]